VIQWTAVRVSGFRWIASSLSLLAMTVVFFPGDRRSLHRHCERSEAIQTMAVRGSAARWIASSLRSSQ
jgi:hypothetical protein